MSKNRTDNPNIASSRIDFLEKDEIFVFGSNWKSHTNLTHAGKYFRPSKVKITSPTLPK